MIPRISIGSVAETLFFDRVKGALRQRLELKALMFVQGCEEEGVAVVEAPDVASLDEAASKLK